MNPVDAYEVFQMAEDVGQEQVPVSSFLIYHPAQHHLRRLIKAVNMSIQLGVVD